ncbi:hypothetical protein AAH678_01305 [Sodalis endosymbiont of Spalangia cameroni]|uniref:hypothetical protein n=1 Tax=Sodalis praecaptivus TaxID=1239307 RepID=UPI0031F761FA
MKQSGLTTGQAIMVLTGLMIFMLSVGLGFAWLLLWAWNLLASSTGWMLIPVNCGTVFAAMIILWSIRQMVKRDK